jgi:hypothetical protein
MSLEQALERNTEMMADLIRALEGFQPAAQQEAPPVPKAVLKRGTLTTSEEKPSGSSVTATLGTTSTPATTAGIEYAQVAAAITSTFKIDRAKVVAALAKFGAAKGPQLKVEDYAAFLQELAA